MTFLMYKIKYWPIRQLRKVKILFQKIKCKVRRYHRDGPPRIEMKTMPTWQEIKEGRDITREDGKIVEFIYCKDCGTLIRKYKVDSVTISNGIIR
jgi:hypothetical protein